MKQVNKRRFHRLTGISFKPAPRQIVLNEPYIPRNLTVVRHLRQELGHTQELPQVLMALAPILVLEAFRKSKIPNGLRQRRSH